jgi:outer membrane receptor for ferric coprogen and ferric-rhodotorulic acid
MVRKRATHDFQAQVEAEAGSWDKKRLVGDISGPLINSGRIRGRVVAMLDDSDSFVDYVYDNKRGLYGVLDADLTETTTLSASVQYQKNHGRTYYGIPMGPDGRDLGLSRATFLGNVNNRSEKEYSLYTVNLQQKLPSDWLLNLAYQHNKTEVDLRYGGFLGGSLNVTTGDGLRLSQYRSLEREFTSDTLDIYASGPLQLWGRKHEFVVGVNRAKMRDKTLNSGKTPTNVNIYHFDPHQVSTPPILDTRWPSPNETWQQGVYGVARMNLTDSLKLILGTRVSWYEYKNSNGVKTQDEKAVVTPYAGIVYDLNDQYSLYASYSDIFKPQSNLSRSGNALDPIIGANYETGIKGEFFNGNLNAAAAIFRLEQTNLAKQDEAFGNDPGNVCSGWCYIAQGKVISQGADFSLNGEMTPNWNIGAGYTYVKSEYASGTQKGDPYNTQTPKHIFRAFSSYHIPGSGWTIGGNVRVQSRFYNAGTSNGINYKINQGGMALAGLMAQYRINQQAELNLTIDNLFDRKYYASAEGLYYVYYGEPRRFALTARYHF